MDAANSTSTANEKTPISAGDAQAYAACMSKTRRKINCVSVGGYDYQLKDGATAEFVDDLLKLSGDELIAKYRLEKFPGQVDGGNG